MLRWVMMSNNDEYFWVPEHPRLNLYRAREPKRTGKLGTRIEITTASIHDAMKFSTKEQCDAWIAENPHPMFVAREHGIMGALVINRDADK